MYRVIEFQLANRAFQWTPDRSLFEDVRLVSPLRFGGLSRVFLTPRSKINSSAPPSSQSNLRQSGNEFTGKTIARLEDLCYMCNAPLAFQYKHQLVITFQRAKLFLNFASRSHHRKWFWISPATVSDICHCFQQSHTYEIIISIASFFLGHKFNYMYIRIYVCSIRYFIWDFTNDFVFCF